MQIEKDDMNQVGFSYKGFTEQSFYTPVNAYLVNMADLKPGQKVVELACGTGAVTQMILEKLRGARDSLVIGIDVSASALKEAMGQLSTARDVALEFVHSRAEHVSDIVREQVDSIIFCNGIHMVSDKQVLLSQVATSLKSGGVFAFNTSFFQGAHPPETERFYNKWMFKAMRLLRSKYGVMPTNKKVDARRQLTPEQYEELLILNGFTVRKQTIHPAPMTCASFEAISQYEGFIEGAMPGVPLEMAKEALQEGVRLAFKELGVQSVPRNWLTVVATRS